MLMLTFMAAAAAGAAPPIVRVDPPLDRAEIRQALTERMGQRQLDLLIASVIEDDGVPQAHASRETQGKLAYRLR